MTDDLTLMSAHRFGPDLSDAEKADVLDEIAARFPLCINVLDPIKGEFTYISAAWEELTGAPVERWLEDPEAWVEMIHPEDRQYTQELADNGKDRAMTARDVRILHRDGSIHWIHGWLAPITDDEGNVFRVIGISHDITARKLLDAELRQKIVELEQALRKRTLEVQHLQELAQREPTPKWVREAVVGAVAAYGTLTTREREIFRRVVCGDMNKTIAAELSIALATVKVHRGRVMSKFGVDSVARLVALALRSGLVGDEEMLRGLGPSEDPA